MEELRSVVYDKEVEITVDHMGKRREEKISMENLIKFNSIENKINKEELGKSVSCGILLGITKQREQLQQPLQLDMH